MSNEDHSETRSAIFDALVLSQDKYRDELTQSLLEVFVAQIMSALVFLSYNGEVVIMYDEPMSKSGTRRVLLTELTKEVVEDGDPDVISDLKQALVDCLAMLAVA